MSVSARLSELGIELPEVPRPLAAYVPALALGGQVRTSGQLPLVDGGLPAQGKVGEDVTPEVAKDLAATAALNALAAAASVAGGVDGIARVVHATVYVASVPGFTGQPQVANGASELFGEIFGEAGAHTRAAVGVAVLPVDSPVEVEVVFELA
ncbi:MAG: RidA family protein [Actinomycetaceae bacterium]|nr:RidA family protein [Actinomycetaceae bacterium]